MRWRRGLFVVAVIAVVGIGFLAATAIIRKSRAPAPPAKAPAVTPPAVPQPVAPKTVEPARPPVAPTAAKPVPVPDNITDPNRKTLYDRSQSETARNNAANELGNYAEEHLVSDLTRMLWDETETPKWRNYCVQHLYVAYERKEDPAVLATLFKAAECAEVQVKICAIWSLARAATPRDEKRMPDAATLGRMRALALDALKDEKAHFLVREAGVQSCARMGLTEALPEIRKLALDEKTEPAHLRVLAIASLGELRDIGSEEALKGIVARAAGQVKSAAELALKRIREPAPEKRPSREGAETPDIQGF